MSELFVRAATNADVSLIVTLLEELADYEELKERFELSEEVVRRDMLGQACHCDLAFVADAPVGVATWFWTYKSFSGRRGLFVEDLYVRTSFRGRGLGRALLAHLAAKALAAGAFLEWQVLDWNVRSLGFYQGLGAKPVEHWLNYRLDGESLKRLAW
jgi:GNAT superfamily N-acetyltransferase